MIGWKQRIQCYELLNGVNCSQGTKDRLRREWEHDQLAEALRTQEIEREIQDEYEE